MALSLPEWLAFHALGALFWLWVLAWGGARWLEGWKAWGVLGWFAGHWDAEQLRLYALVLLVLQGAWFVIGLFVPAWRFAP